MAGINIVHTSKPEDARHKSPCDLIQRERFCPRSRLHCGPSWSHQIWEFVESRVYQGSSNRPIQYSRKEKNRLYTKNFNSIQYHLKYACESKVYTTLASPSPNGWRPSARPRRAHRPRLPALVSLITGVGKPKKRNHTAYHVAL